MKKNEMITAIQEEFNLPDGMAQAILEFVEQVGMLPPLREKIDTDRFVGYSNPQYPSWDDENSNN
jgi:hypothetical protein